MPKQQGAFLRQEGLLQGLQNAKKLKETQKL
jgi:hypothetical protein